MVYISNDGSVYNKQPWSLSKVTGIFYGLFVGVGLFLQSLIEPLLPGDGSGSGVRGLLGFGRGGGGSGGGSGGNGGSGGPGFPRRRPIGRIMRMSDVTVPGGCPGGSCGR